MEVPQAGRPRESENYGHWPETGVEPADGQGRGLARLEIAAGGYLECIPNPLFHLIIKHSVSDGFV